jgi:hypothetical protein
LRKRTHDTTSDNVGRHTGSNPLKLPDNFGFPRVKPVRTLHRDLNGDADDDNDADLSCTFLDIASCLRLVNMIYSVFHL